jgi:hypothetical protein
VLGLVLIAVLVLTGCDDLPKHSPPYTLGTLEPEPGLSSAQIEWHALRDGALVAVDDSEAEGTENEIVPAPGYFGATHTLRSATLSQDEWVAAVAGNGRPAAAQAETLLIGSYGGTAFPVAQATTITRPSCTADGSATWAVLDGDQVIRAVHDRVTGKIFTQNVDVSALFAPSTKPVSTPRAPITELRIDPTGVRAALIASGKVYVAAVSIDPEGRHELVSPVAVPLGAPAVSLDWRDPDSIAVALDGTVNPVQNVELDNFVATPIDSRSLTPPIRAISASPYTLYVADARGVMQWRTDERFWREVSGLGPNATPVLPG